jgi:hypothetical protein
LVPRVGSQRSVVAVSAQVRRHALTSSAPCYALRWQRGLRHITLFAQDLSHLSAKNVVNFWLCRPFVVGRFIVWWIAINVAHRAADADPSRPSSPRAVRVAYGSGVGSTPRPGWRGAHRVTHTGPSARFCLPGAPPDAALSARQQPRWSCNGRSTRRPKPSNRELASHTLHSGH